MKNIIKAFAVLAGVAALAACNQYAEYTWTPYVSMDVRSTTVEESDPATAVTIPVHLFNHDGACSVSYTVVAGGAKEGVDYTLADASGVLNFAAGSTTQNITVNVTGQPGVYTGALTFKVVLSSATEGVTIGALSTCTVNIKDLDHPLAAILGNYTADGTCAFGRNSQWPVTFTADENDDHKVWIDYIIGFIDLNDIYSWGDWSVYGIVSDDLKTITIPYLQSNGVEYDSEGDFLTLYKWGVSGGAPVVDDSAGDLKLVWNDTYGGFINDGRICFAGLKSGLMGNYYCLYYATQSILFKQ